MPQQILLLFLGLPGSGKTYFAKQLEKETKIIRLNGDAMRAAMLGGIDDVEHNSPEHIQGIKMTYKAMDYAAKQVLASGQSLIYDANHRKRADREHLTELAKESGAKVIIVRVNTPFEIAEDRAVNRKQRTGERKVTPELYNVIADDQPIDAPLEDETVIDIDGQAPFEQQHDVFVKQLDQLQ